MTSGKALDAPLRGSSTGAASIRFRMIAGLAAAVALLSSVWALASPLGSVPDEYMHYKYAYALWSGQVSATSGEYQIPETLALPRQECFNQRATVPAGCSLPLAAATDEDVDTLTRTTANRYPPLYYALTGWLIRISPNDLGIYAARIVGALICSALVALACWRLVLTSRRAVLGWLVCLSPMAFYFFGGYNPQGLELASSVLLISAGIGLVRAPSRLDAGIVLAASVALALVRPAGFVWPGLILPLLLIALWRRERGFPLGWFLAACAAAAVVAGGAWSVLFPADATGQTNPGTTLSALLSNSAARFLEFPKEWVGVFGGLDAPVSSLVIAAWWGVAGVVVLIGLGSRNTRVLIAVGLAVLAGTLFALAIEYRVEAGWGYVMLQGRYVLPLVYFCLVLLALAGQSVRIEPIAGVLAAMGGVWALVQTAAVAQGLQRFIYGQNVSPIGQAAGWNPPVPALVLLVAALAASMAIAVVVQRLVVGTGPLPAQEAVST